MGCICVTGSNFSFAGCFVNKGADRVDGHAVDHTYANCATKASAGAKTVFGMEYPQGYDTPGNAQCLVLGALPSMVKVADSECEGEGLFKGKRLGGPNRLAVYQRGSDNRALIKDWINVGDSSDDRLCKTHTEAHGGPPAWGVRGHIAEQVLLCCSGIESAPCPPRERVCRPHRFWTLHGQGGVEVGSAFWLDVLPCPQVRPRTRP